ncbi:MAG TPA: O-antigen ligase family protein [Planctomycetaceae bacterium]|nr:O-antigen ligase family protein [Planctomycetaceae bacterium]
MNRPARSSAKRSSAFGNDTPLSELILLRAVDVGLGGVLFVTPLLLGGRTALGRIWLIACCALAALAWCALQMVHRRPRLNFCGAELLLVLGGLLIGLQLTQLSPQMLQTLSPKLEQILPASSDGAADRWQTLSLWPESTRIGCAVFICYALFFLVLFQRLRDVDDIERILRWSALAATGLALLGLLQYFAGNGKFLWVFDHPYSDAQDHVKASFTNRNHFAQFMALGVGPLIWFILNGLAASPSARSGTGFGRGRQSGSFMQAPFLIGLCALALVVFAGLLSLSRGGAMALAAAGLTATVLLYRSGALDVRFALGLGGFAAIVGTLLSIYGEQAVSLRLGELFSADPALLESDGGVGRNRIWDAAILAIRDFAWCGTGLGSHAEVHPLYMVVAPGMEYTHAENGYLQLGVECGLAGLGLMLFGLLCLAVWSLLTTWPGGDRRVAVCGAACAASLAASAAHSFGDFVWYAPGCMMMTIAAAACACRARQLSRASAGAAPAEWSLPRPGWLVAGAAVAAATLWTLSIEIPELLAEPHYDAYLAIGRDPAVVEEGNPLIAEIRELRATLRSNPQHARARTKLARKYLAWFNELQRDSENPMTIEQLRDAAIASDFPSHDACEAWLDRAVGKKRKLLELSLKQADAALRLCPLQGDAYVLRAKLGFLDDPHADATTDLEQAARVRPYSGDILFDIGEEAYLKGDEEKTMAMWKRAFRVPGPHRNRIIDFLVGHVKIEFILEEFQPDVEALQAIASQCEKLERQDDYHVVLHKRAEAYTEAAQKLLGPAAAQAWLAAHWNANQINDDQLAADTIQKAYAFDPNSFDVRRALALWLFHHKDLQAAAPHLTWCLQRQPEDGEVAEAARIIHEQLALGASDTTRH